MLHVQQWTTFWCTKTVLLLPTGSENILWDCINVPGTTFWCTKTLCLVPAGSGNILWDCINVLQPETARHLHDLGGIQAIAISHPHFFGGIATWAEEFDAPVYIHEKDKRWVTEPNTYIQPWSGLHSAHFSCRSDHAANKADACMAAHAELCCTPLHVEWS